MIRTIRFLVLIVLTMSLVSVVSAAPLKYCFEVYGSGANGSDPGVYSIIYSSVSDVKITKTGVDEPDWVSNPVNFNGFEFQSSFTYHSLASGTQFRSTVYGKPETIIKETWLRVESIDGNYLYQEPWYSGIPYAAAWQNNNLVIASPYGTDSVKIQIYVVRGKDSHQTPKTLDFNYSQQPTEILGIRWDNCRG